MPLALPFRPAQIETGESPSVRHYVMKVGETFVLGSPMTINAGEVDELDTADVTLIVGIAGAKQSSAYGYDMADSPTVITGRADTVPVWLATRDTVFMGQISTGTTLVVPIAADVNGTGFGVVRLSDGTWTVNRSDVTTKTVRVVDFVTQGPECADQYGLVWFKFLESTLYA